MLDTSVAIHLRDGDPRVTERIAALNDAVVLSVVTRVDLEGGVHRHPADGATRRARLDVLLNGLPCVAFDDAAAEAYAGIVAAAGYSRRKLLDRMIAAQALVHRATLATLNPGHFRDVPGLRVEDWT
jgi:tRNA(fMet)-specific endonuclease VapC